MSDRDAFRANRDAGLKARHETREARAVRKQVAEEIAKVADELVRGLMNPDKPYNAGYIHACKSMAGFAREIGSRDPQ